VVARAGVTRACVSIRDSFSRARTAVRERSRTPSFREEDPMKFMIHFTVTEAAGARIEAAQGGPAPLISYLVDRFKPQAAFVSPAKREGWMVANFDEQRLAEAMIFITNRFGAYPEITPVLSLEDFPKVVTPAIEAVAKSPKL
jgi:hypothetical protein